MTEQDRVQQSKFHKDLRAGMLLIVSGLCGWGLYSLTIEVGMEPRAIWFILGSAIVFLWLIGVTDKLFDAEYAAYNAQQRAESYMASLERLSDKLKTDIDTSHKV